MRESELESVGVVDGRSHMGTGMLLSITVHPLYPTAGLVDAELICRSTVVLGVSRV